MKRIFFLAAVLPAFLFAAGPVYFASPPVTLDVSNHFGMPVATSSVNGYLSSTDWTTFNNKQSLLSLGNITDGGTDGISITGGTSAIIGSGVAVSQHVADSLHAGYLSSSDWTTFNNKQSALTIGNLTDAGTDGITVTSGTGAVIGSGTSLSQHVADTTHNGYLSSSDWNTFSGKGTGSVTSVALSLPGIFSVSGSPVTVSGTLTGSLATQTANTVFAGPSSGIAAAPTFRSLVGADLPNPSASTLGGVESLAAVSHNFLTSISTSGVPAQAQPAFTDISGSLAGSQLPTFTGDVTNSSAAMTVAKIAGTTVSGTTGTGNVLFSASPTLTGTAVLASATVSGSIKSGNCHLEPQEVDIGNSGASQAVDLSTGNVFTSTLTANTTFTFSNPQTGCPYVFILTQDGTGSRSLTTAGVTVIWGSGGFNVLSTAASAVDKVTCVYNGSITKLMCDLATQYQ